MSAKSFFTSIPGVITGVAGVITATLGLYGVATQVGWIGGDGGGSSSTTATTATGQKSGAATSPRTGDDVGAGTGSSSDDSDSADAPPQFRVTPTTVDFGALLSSPEKSVTLQNIGSAPFEVGSPKLTDETAFEVVDVDCAGAEVAPREDCQVRVAFAPTAPGNYSAKLQIPVADGERTAEVLVKGSKAL